MSFREEQNKVLVHQLFDRIMARDLEGILVYFDPDFVEHGTLPGTPAGTAALRAFFSTLFTGFPDAQTTILEMFAKGDKVVVRANTEGTHRGPFIGIPPTGRRARWSFIAIHRIANGRIVEHWVETDQMSLMQQLGLVPPPRAIG